MIRCKIVLAFIKHLIVFSFGVCLISVLFTCSSSTWPNSPDGRYKAKRIKVKSAKDVHYQIIEKETGKALFTTNAQYSTPNDVKAGLFSPDSKEFAAAYHYGHEGNYTWIGIWNIDTGNLIRTEKKSGWIRNISWVFKN